MAPAGSAFSARAAAQRYRALEGAPAPAPAAAVAKWLLSIMLQQRDVMLNIVAGEN